MKIRQHIRAGSEFLGKICSKCWSAVGSRQHIRAGSEFLGKIYSKCLRAVVSQYHRIGPLPQAARRTVRMAAIGLLAVGTAYALFAPADRVDVGIKNRCAVERRHRMSKSALLNGVWRSRGNGWVIEIRGGRATLLRRDEINLPTTQRARPRACGHERLVQAQ